MKATLRKTLIAISIVVALLWVGWRSLCAITCPFFIINHDPQATVFVDGRKQVFEKGRSILSPWKTHYVVEVRSKRGIERRRIYPLAPESDSGGVTVDKKGTVFNVKNEAVD